MCFLSPAVLPWELCWSLACSPPSSPVGDLKRGFPRWAGRRAASFCPLPNPPGPLQGIPEGPPASDSPPLCPGLPSRLFMEILNSVTDCDEIQFMEDGSWCPMKPKKEPPEVCQASAYNGLEGRRRPDHGVRILQGLGSLGLGSGRTLWGLPLGRVWGLCAEQSWHCCWRACPEGSPAGSAHRPPESQQPLGRPAALSLPFALPLQGRSGL